VLRKDMRSPAPIALALTLAAAACSRPADRAAPAASSNAVAPPITSSATSPPAPTAQTGSSPGAPAKGALLLGEPVTSPIVPLTEIARTPGRFDNQLVATSGKVTAVCQEMGCWMEIQDASGRAHVRMHGHSFFVPRTAAGHMARVQARVVRHRESCQESPAPQAETAKIELDATGVELD